ncbi:MAG: hypothetical protein COV67_09870, partial [Nitrospinae bacterium CG11_big_fil_rev_8_21_14_0_20_56_8]
YIHDEDRHQLRGRNNGITYRLGDRVTVVLREVTPITGGMLFEVSDSAAPAGSKATSTPRARTDPSKTTKRPKKAKGKSRASRRQQRNAVDSTGKKGANTKNKGRPKRK